jgi:hypothetical protein
MVAVRVSARPGNGMCPRGNNTHPGLSPLQRQAKVTPSPWMLRVEAGGTETPTEDRERKGIPAVWHRQRATPRHTGRGWSRNLRPRQGSGDLQTPDRARCERGKPTTSVVGEGHDQAHGEWPGVVDSKPLSEIRVDQLITDDAGYPRLVGSDTPRVPRRVCRLENKISVLSAPGGRSDPVGGRTLLCPVSTTDLLAPSGATYPTPQ